MSVKSQESNMRRLSALLSHDLSYAYGDSECGPNGSKKVFLNVGKAFLRALAKDLGLRDATVSANPGGIAVSGECIRSTHGRKRSRMSFSSMWRGLPIPSLIFVIISPVTA